MIRVIIQTDKHGCLKELTASGHAQLARKGKDILCAAVTTITRTVMKVLYDHEGVEAYGETLQRGKLVLVVSGYTESAREWVRGVSQFCITALEDLALEFPRGVRVKLRKAQLKHG